LRINGRFFRAARVNKRLAQFFRKRLARFFRKLLDLHPRPGRSMVKSDYMATIFAQGAQIEHSKFGLGTVMSSSEERIVIKFDDHGEKKFITPMVLGSLKKSDRQPPVEKRATRRRSKAVQTSVS